MDSTYTTTVARTYITIALWLIWWLVRTILESKIDNVSSIYLSIYFSPFFNLLFSPSNCFSLDLFLIFSILISPHPEIAFFTYSSFYLFINSFYLFVNSFKTIHFRSMVRPYMWSPSRPFFWNGNIMLWNDTQNECYKLW